jgi:hypothetical protein
MLMQWIAARDPIRHAETARESTCGNPASFGALCDYFS